MGRERDYGERERERETDRERREGGRKISGKFCFLRIRVREEEKDGGNNL